MSKKEGRKAFERRRKEALKHQGEEGHLGVTKNKREEKEMGPFLPGKSVLSISFQEISNFFLLR